MSETVVTTAHETVFGAVAQFTLLLALAAMSLVMFYANGVAHVPLPLRMSSPSHWLEDIVVPGTPTAFEQEAAMDPDVLLDRWNPFVTEASRRFGLPKSWIRAVINQESGGRTMMAEGAPITSAAGAQGIMQITPETYDEMRAQLGLGSDAYDPHDNVIAGAAYLHWLYKKYGYPQMFAAYNDGPGNFDRYLAGGHALPPETIAYLERMTATLGDKPRRKVMREASLSRSGGMRG